MALADDYKGWKEYWMAALYDGRDTPAQLEVVLAPNTDWAFKRARALWPWADAWEFLGYAVKNDRERVNYNKKRIIQKVQQIEEER